MRLHLNCQISIKSGEYKLATAIVNDKNNNLPEIALALKDAEVQSRLVCFR